MQCAAPGAAAAASGGETQAPQSLLSTQERCKSNRRPISFLRELSRRALKDARPASRARRIARERPVPALDGVPSLPPVRQFFNGAPPIEPGVYGASGHFCGSRCVSLLRDTIARSTIGGRRRFYSLRPRECRVERPSHVGEEAGRFFFSVRTCAHVDTFAACCPRSHAPDVLQAHSSVTQVKCALLTR